MNRAWRRRSECQVPGNYDVDETMGLDPVWKDGWNKEVVQICINPKEQRNTILTLVTLIFLPCPPIAGNQSSGESAIERVDRVCWIRPTRACVDMSQGVTVSFVK